MNTVAIFRATTLRTWCTSARTQMRSMSQGSGSHMGDAKQWPSKHAQHKKKDTSAHFNKDGGWAEETASSAEAAVKADRGHHHKGDNLKELQNKSAEIMAKKQGKKAGKH